ncbi:hypothetical protein P171DRAFT_427833 [Karstenula rhodostoma CBS 690.94]|uniref:Ras guanyl-nucleotide exchange factor RasGEF n=1 Tax=Karstenula rhodostoma CBS 690.94 TaxID=1392251 RepID=A0A9P4PUU9_9PLEO|nr:hypothetical protein P171DRAFT_427833 [Karstenula rhodostoma CBS 690.94]
MASSTPQVRSIYRRLLRELPSPGSPTPSTRSATTPPKFRSSSHQKLSAPSAIQKRIRDTISKANSASQMAQAEQFVQYVQAQRMYATLIERYNPGMGMSEEERVRLSARRVGVNLPTEFVKGQE